MKEKKTQASVAKKVGATPMMFSHVLNNRYKTANILLAIEIAKLKGGSPADYLTERGGVRDLAIKLNPKLKKSVSA